MMDTAAVATISVLFETRMARAMPSVSFGRTSETTSDAAAAACFAADVPCSAAIPMSSLGALFLSGMLLLLSFGCVRVDRWGDGDLDGFGGDVGGGFRGVF